MDDERVDPTEPVEVSLMLRPRQTLPDAAQAAEAPPMTREAFAEAYGADPSDLAKVEAFATAHGLRILESDPGRRTVRVSGSAAQISDAFAVNLLIQPSVDGADYRAPEHEPAVPSELDGVVAGVFGLDTRPTARRLHTFPISGEAAV